MSEDIFCQALRDYLIVWPEVGRGHFVKRGDERTYCGRRGDAWAYELPVFDVLKLDRPLCKTCGRSAKRRAENL